MVLVSTFSVAIVMELRTTVAVRDGMTASCVICRQLNPDGSDDTPDGFKPKGMHWKTYDRLCRERERLGGAMAQYVEQLFGVRFW